LPCPHCGLETKINIPVPKKENVPTESSSPTPSTMRREGFFCGGDEPIPAQDSAVQLATEGTSTQRPLRNAPELPEEPQSQSPILEAERNPVLTSDNESAALHRHKRVRFTKGTRIALSHEQRESPTGKELINLLDEIVRDGVNTDGLITEDGIRRLNSWLDKKNDSDIPAVKFLLQISDRILRTGRVTTAKAFEMHFAIERVLPMPLREEFKKIRQDAWAHSPLKPRATEAQLEYIRGLGGVPLPGMNTAEASMLIEKLLELSTPPSEQSATEKQIQFIRELGGNVPAGLSKADASLLIKQLQAKQRDSFANEYDDNPCLGQGVWTAAERGFIFSGLGAGAALGVQNYVNSIGTVGSFSQLPYIQPLVMGGSLEGNFTSWAGLGQAAGNATSLAVGAVLNP